MTPLVSVVVVTHDSTAEIVRCLQSIVAAAGGTPTEIIVVDAGSRDATAAAVRGAGIPHKLISLRNVGFAAAANAGAARAGGELLFFLNPDARVQPDAIARLWETFRDPRVAAVGGLLVDPEGVPERWQDIPFPSLGRILSHHLALRRPGRASPIPHAPFPMPHSVPWVSGGALAIRRGIFERLGGFAERFFLYFEDVDLCWRTRQQGGRILLHPRLRVHHTRGVPSRGRRRAYDRAQDIFFARARPSGERRTVRVLRGIVRRGASVAPSVGLALLAALSASLTEALWPLLAIAGAASLVFTIARAPRTSVLLLVASLLLGQSLRMPVGPVQVTVTDLLLPLVLLGLGLFLVRARRVRMLVRHLCRGWWVPAALLPGLLIAFERLPGVESSVMVAYALRLGMALLLIPVLRSVGMRAAFVRGSLLVLALLLMLLGAFQLLVLPTIPPPRETLAVQLFLSGSGGGWDPHQDRMFATWLDPNFLGGFFVLAFALALGNHWWRGPRTAAIGALMLLASTLTQSRASMIALLAVSLVFLLVGRARRLLMPLASVLLLAFTLFPGLPERAFTVTPDDPTVRLRLQSWGQAVDHWERFPLFGVGYNAYGAEQLLRGHVTDPALHSRAGADNAVLTSLVTTGLFGTALLALGILASLRRLLLRARRGSASALGAFLAFVGLLVHSQFLHSFTYIHLLVPLALVLGSVRDDEGSGNRGEGAGDDARDERRQRPPW